MFTQTFFLALAAMAGVNSAAVEYRDTAAQCTPEMRIAGGQGVIFAYAQNEPGATYEAFREIPFGDRGLDGKCILTILADGLPGAPVGFTGNDIVNFGTLTRQVFSKVTGFYTDFPQNNSMAINTNVTLGVRSIVPVPVTFSADVFLDYTPECRIKAVRAYARIPSEVLGFMTKNPGVPPIIAKLIGTDNPINSWFGTPAPTSK